MRPGPSLSGVPKDYPASSFLGPFAKRIELHVTQAQSSKQKQATHENAREKKSERARTTLTVRHAVLKDELEKVRQIKDENKDKELSFDSF